MSKEKYVVLALCVIITAWAATLAGNMYVFGGSYMSGAAIIASLGLEDWRYLFAAAVIAFLAFIAVNNAFAFAAIFFAGACMTACLFWLEEE